jgi:hypothetical protein
MGLKQDRPKITKSNIVCAELMPSRNQMLKEFVANLQPKGPGAIGIYGPSGESFESGARATASIMIAQTAAP